MTPSRYHREQLGALATIRATEGEPVKQIAAELGCGEATIRRLVRQTAGVTVRKLRENLRERANARQPQRRKPRLPIEARPEDAARGR